MTAIAVSVMIAAALSKNMRKRFRRYGSERNSQNRRRPSSWRSIQF